MSDAPYSHVPERPVFQVLADKKGSPEFWEKKLNQLNLGKNQIHNQNLKQLRQSIISINSLIAKINKDFLEHREKSDRFSVDYDINATLLILIQRKTLIVDRYKIILKRDILSRMKGLIGQLSDDPVKLELEKYIIQLEYIEFNKQNFIGKLQSLI
jgi:hypothetical protein